MPEVQGTARWPEWLEWRERRDHDMREGQRGNGAASLTPHTPATGNHLGSLKAMLSLTSPLFQKLPLYPGGTPQLCLAIPFYPLSLC